MPSVAYGRPARFDQTSQHRRALLAKIHVGKKELGLVDDDYRGLLFRVTGETSAADCSDAQLVAIVEDMKAKGFTAMPAAKRGGARRPAPADHPTARKARAIWISLGQLGAIDNPSDQALEAFAKRQLGVDRLQWANQAQGYKLIEALKAIGKRHGWEQETRGLSPSGAVKVLKLRLADAILAKLKKAGLAGDDWDLATAAFRLLGMESSKGSPSFWDVGAIEALAQGLAGKLKAAK